MRPCTAVDAPSFAEARKPLYAKGRSKRGFTPANEPDAHRAGATMGRKLAVGLPDPWAKPGAGAIWIPGARRPRLGVPRIPRLFRVLAGVASDPMCNRNPGQPLLYAS